MNYTWKKMQHQLEDNLVRHRNMFLFQSSEQAKKKKKKIQVFII